MSLGCRGECYGNSEDHRRVRVLLPADGGVDQGECGMLDGPQWASNGTGPSPKPCSISRPDRGRQPTDGCGPLSHYTYIKGGRGPGARTMKFTAT
jgi:hypothetical protein